MLAHCNFTSHSWRKATVGPIFYRSARWNQAGCDGDRCEQCGDRHVHPGIERADGIKLGSKIARKPHGRAYARRDPDYDH
jgi:hypothetical protein